MYAFFSKQALEESERIGIQLSEGYFYCDAIGQLEEHVTAARPSWLCVIANHDKIDERLCMHLSVICSQIPNGFGIIPYDGRQTGCLQRLLSAQIGASADNYRIAFHSVRRDYFDELPHPPLSKSEQRELNTTHCLVETGPTGTTQCSAVVNALSQEPLTAFAAALNGRQTYCMTASNINITTYPLAKPRNDCVAIETISCENFFVQSCHSPFVWRQYGDYYSLPLAAIILGSANTFIASTRIQTPVDGLLFLYRELAVRGTSVGQITKILNERCKDYGTDIYPFLLFGHPASKIVSKDGALVEAKSDVTLDLASQREFWKSVETIQNLLSNLQFLTQRRYLWRDCRAGPRLTELINLVADSANEVQTRTTSMHGRSQFPSIWLRGGLRALAKSLTNDKFDIEAVTGQLNHFWRAQLGYYYGLEQISETNYRYLTSEVSPPAEKDLTDVIVRKHLLLAGGFPAPDYVERIQHVTSRSLMVADLAKQHERDIEVMTLSNASGCELHVTYTNTSERLQWVHSFGVANDPNNMSINAAKLASRTLLSRLTITGLEGQASLVAPGDKVIIDVRVNGAPPELFYLLLEYNIFVDFCWSWISLTWSRDGLRDWTLSPAYPDTLPLGRL